MDWKQVKRNWWIVSQQIKRKWGKFTEHDLAMIDGRRDSFVRMFELRYGDDESDAGRKIDAFVEGLTSQPKAFKFATWTQRQWLSIKRRFNSKTETP